ncbi:hypothetical protein N8T08_005585 [Aspergillus melleus]|uniref:Uncharacterized protein n=1 Tax=Aspergillus melleus TaxID=138277 RepID=A0ACC3B228_9EURO|nr:hypothetical protein N8T08_005585 [Aspergillus melleus]
MTIYPKVQQKAQEEIDHVVGCTRLSNAKDRGKLPYIDALAKETLRWKPVAPMGLPHTSTADDIFDWDFLPKGTTVLANVWYFTHNPATYPNPMSFNPGRFLPTDKKPTLELDPHRFAFGFGRRMCPSRFLADSMIFLNIAQSLAFKPGVVSHPHPFMATITPRSEKHEQLVRDIEKVFPWQRGDADKLAVFVGMSEVMKRRQRSSTEAEA